MSLKDEDVNPKLDGCSADHRWKKVSMSKDGIELWAQGSQLLTDCGLMKITIDFDGMVKRINMYEVWTTQVVKVQIEINGSYAILRNWETQSVFEDLDWNKSQS